MAGIVSAVDVFSMFTHLDMEITAGQVAIYSFVQTRSAKAWLDQLSAEGYLRWRYDAADAVIYYRLTEYMKELVREVIALDENPRLDTSG